MIEGDVVDCSVECTTYVVGGIEVVGVVLMVEIDKVDSVVEDDLVDFLVEYSTVGDGGLEVVDRV